MSESTASVKMVCVEVGGLPTAVATSGSSKPLTAVQGTGQAGRRKEPSADNHE